MHNKNYFLITEIELKRPDGKSYFVNNKNSENELLKLSVSFSTYIHKQTNNKSIVVPKVPENLCYFNTIAIICYLLI